MPCALGNAFKDMNASDVNELFRLYAGFCFDCFALSETRPILLLVPGKDGVIDKDFGKSGKFSLDENELELN